MPNRERVRAENHAQVGVVVTAASALAFAAAPVRALAFDCATLGERNAASSSASGGGTVAVAVAAEGERCPP